MVVVKYLVNSIVVKKIIYKGASYGKFREISLVCDLRVHGKDLFYIFKKLTLARVFPGSVYLNLFGRAYFY